MLTTLLRGARQVRTLLMQRIAQREQRCVRVGSAPHAQCHHAQYPHRPHSRHSERF